MCVLAAISCGRPSSSSHLEMLSKNFTYLQVVQFSCPMGFLLMGAVEATCMTSGLWSAASPLCSPISCGTPSAPDHSIRESVNQSFNGTAEFLCPRGFVASPPILSLICLANGSWSSPLGWMCHGECFISVHC